MATKGAQSIQNTCTASNNVVDVGSQCKVVCSWTFSHIQSSSNFSPAVSTQPAVELSLLFRCFTVSNFYRQREGS